VRWDEVVTSADLGYSSKYSNEYHNTVPVTS